jgi:hypothetical protein
MRVFRTRRLAALERHAIFVRGDKAMLASARIQRETQRIKETIERLGDLNLSQWRRAFQDWWPIKI